MTASPTLKQLEYIWDDATYNATEESPYGPGKFGLGDWMLILSLLISLVGLVGNGLVLWLLGFCIKRNPFSVYILNLAMADALFLCGTFGSIMNDFMGDFYFMLMDWILLFFRYTFYTVGLSLLATISMERCLATLFPIWHRCNRPKNTSTVMCTVLWAVATLLWGTGLVVCYHLDNEDCEDFIIIEFTWFSLFTPVLGVSSLALLLRVQCNSWHRQPPRLYLLVLLSVLIFVLCGLPMGILDFVSLFHKQVLPSWVPQLLTCVNSSANPFIYFFLGRQRHKRRRETLRVILQRALEDKQDLEVGERDAPHTHHDSEMSS